MSSVDKKKVPIFAWASAISVGGLLSFVLFLTGSDSLDSFMIDLGIRTAVNSYLSEGFLIGDTYVSVNIYSVLGLDEDGVSFNAAHRTQHNNEAHVFYTSGSIKSPKNKAVKDGTITTVSIIPEQLAESIFLDSCVTTARYNFGIPIYHYNISSIHQPQNKIPLADVMRAFPRYILAESLARRYGETNFERAYILPESIVEFVESGYTFNWRYCAEDWEGNKSDAKEFIVEDRS